MSLAPKYSVGDIVYIRNPQEILTGPRPRLARKLLLTAHTPGVPQGERQLTRHYRVIGREVADEYDSDIWVYGIRRILGGDEEYIIGDAGLWPTPPVDVECEPAVIVLTPKYKSGDRVYIVNSGYILRGELGNLTSALCLHNRRPYAAPTRDYTPDWHYQISGWQEYSGKMYYGVILLKNGKYLDHEEYIVQEEGLQLCDAAPPKFDVGALVHVTDWSWVYDNDQDTAKTMWLDKHGWKDSQAPFSSSPSIVWRVAAVHALRNVCGIVSMGCSSGGIPMQAFVIGAAGLVAADSAIERLRTVAATPVSISDCTMDGVTKFDYVKTHKPSQFTVACRLRFPNGEEVECPAPPESEGWRKDGARKDLLWPAHYVNDSTQQIAIRGSVHNPQSTLMFWHEYARRALAEQAQILWTQCYRKDIKPPTTPPAYQKVYEFL